MRVTGVQACALPTAPRARGSSRSNASRIVSLIRSAILSGWPSVTDSEVKSLRPISTHLRTEEVALDRVQGADGVDLEGLHLDRLAAELLQQEDELDEGQRVDQPVLDEIHVRGEVLALRVTLEDPVLDLLQTVSHGSTP